MTRLPPFPRAFFADRRGVVFVEFLIAFVPMWTFFLCVVQLALIAHADLIVKHAADSAARSAVVVLPEGGPRCVRSRGRPDRRLHRACG